MLNQEIWRQDSRGTCFVQPAQGVSTQEATLAMTTLVGSIYAGDDAALLSGITEKPDSVKSKLQGEEYLLHVACKMGRVGAVKILLEAGSDVTAEDSAGRIPLLVAIEKGHVECVRFMLSFLKETKPKWVSRLLSMADIKGNKPIHYGCRNIHILSLLVEACCDNDIVELLGTNETQKTSGMTPLHLASLCDPECCSLLLTMGADANKRTSSGDTAVILASKENVFEAVKALVRGGADVAAANNDQDTALHFACMMENEELAQFLIEAGASTAAVNNDGKTPLDYRTKTTPEALGIESEESLVSVVRSTHLVDDVLTGASVSSPIRQGNLKMTPRQYLEHYVLPDLEPALVALLKRHEKNESRPEHLRQVDVNPCHWIASYILRHKAPLEIDVDEKTPAVRASTAPSLIKSQSAPDL